ncbi:MAG: beta-sandwich domain-containing protein [Candidatus Sumerlaeia bacterium]
MYRSVFSPGFIRNITAGSLLALVMLLPVLFCACQNAAEEDAESQEQNPADYRFNVSGVIMTGDQADPAGIMVFCSGTSYLTFTDGNGRYRLSDIPEGAYTIYAQKVGYEQRQVYELDLRGQNPANGDIELPSSEIAAREPEAMPMMWNVDAGGLAVLAGYVYLTDNAAPLGIRIELKNTTWSALTNENGAFSIAGIVPGNYLMQVSHSGYNTVNLPVSVKPGQVTRLDRQIALSPIGGNENTFLPSIMGKVLFIDKNGRPMEEAPTTTVGIVETEQITDIAQDGSFEFQNLDTGSYTLTASSPGYALNNPVQVQVSDETVTAVLIMQEEGLPQDNTGTLIGRIILQDTQGDYAGTFVAVPGQSNTGATDSRGRFSIRNIEAGMVSFLARHEGYKQLEIDNIEIIAGETTDLGELTLERDVKPPRILGTNPADGDREVVILPTVPVRIVFNKRMQLNSVAQAISIRPECKYSVRKGSLSDADPGEAADVVELLLQNDDPARALQFNTTYRLQVAASATDAENVSLEEAYSMEFRTAGLRIIGSKPEMGAKDVSVRPTDSKYVRFNGKVDLSTLNQRSMNVRPKPMAMSSVNRVDSDPATGWTILYLPMTFQYDKDYSITFDMNIQAVDGTRMDKAFRLRFSTQAMPRQ